MLRMSSLHDLEHGRPLEIEETLRVCRRAGRRRGPCGAHGGHVLPPHSWPQSVLCSARVGNPAGAMERGTIEPGRPAACRLRPLVPRCGFSARVAPCICPRRCGAAPRGFRAWSLAAMQDADPGRPPLGLPGNSLFHGDARLPVAGHRSDGAALSRMRDGSMLHRRTRQGPWESTGRVVSSKHVCSKTSQGVYHAQALSRGMYTGKSADETVVRPQWQEDGQHQTDLRRRSCGLAPLGSS